jgi:hypothetical protein
MGGLVPAIYVFSRCSHKTWMPGTSPRLSGSIFVDKMHDAGIQYAAASRSIADARGILGRPVKPGDDSRACLAMTAARAELDDSGNSFNLY